MTKIQLKTQVSLVPPDMTLWRLGLISQPQLSLQSAEKKTVEIPQDLGVVTEVQPGQPPVAGQVWSKSYSLGVG